MPGYLSKPNSDFLLSTFGPSQLMLVEGEQELLSVLVAKVL
jgi:hypothetical protein